MALTRFWSGYGIFANGVKQNSSGLKVNMVIELCLEKYRRDNSIAIAIVPGRLLHLKASNFLLVCTSVVNIDGYLEYC